MKIIIAPDSFKDSLSAEGVARAIAEGLAQVLPEAQLIECPMADGGRGDGGVGVGGMQRRTAQPARTGPFGRAGGRALGLFAASATAIIEMAEASGLQLVPSEQRNACITSTFGTGELIRAALDAGAQRIILAIGGSATNDAGAGALQALGRGAVRCPRAGGGKRAGLALAGVVRGDP